MPHIYSTYLRKNPLEIGQDAESTNKEEGKCNNFNYRVFKPDLVEVKPFVIVQH